jgi:hypothetical protein
MIAGPQKKLPNQFLGCKYCKKCFFNVIDCQFGRILVDIIRCNGNYTEGPGCFVAVLVEFCRNKLFL